MLPPRINVYEDSSYDIGVFTITTTMIRGFGSLYEKNQSCVS